MAEKPSPESQSDQEEEQTLESLRNLANQWRKRLQDPVTQALVKSGQAQISPLVRKLLAAFPPPRKR